MTMLRIEFSIPVADTLPGDPQPYPAETLGTRIAGAITAGVAPDVTTEASFDSEDDEEIDPNSDLRTDRFGIMEEGILARRKLEAPPASALPPAGTPPAPPANPVPPASTE